MYKSSSKKRVKRKEQNNAIVIISILLIIIALLVYFLIKDVNQDKKQYEYALIGEIGRSNNCYYDDNSYCTIKKIKTKVDSYYEVENEK